MTHGLPMCHLLMTHGMSLILEGIEFNLSLIGPMREECLTARFVADFQEVIVNEK